jgi:hypothetical protein
MSSQAGLLTTYRHGWQTRGISAYALAMGILAFYFILYFTSWLDEPAYAVMLPIAELLAGGALSPEANALLHDWTAKWYLYGLLYTVGVIVGGVYFLRRHGNNKYHRYRTFSLMAVQLVLAFLVPFWMTLFTQRDFYFSYLWPLKIEYFYPDKIFAYPVAFALFSFIASLIVVPILALTIGKRFYCSWVCGCGGLAETAGEPFRHLTSKSTRSWRFEQVAIHTVLFLAIATTAIVLIRWGIHQPGSPFDDFAVKVQSVYGFIVVTMLSGAVAVAGVSSGSSNRGGDEDVAAVEFYCGRLP